jgi:hypothetical protein
MKTVEELELEILRYHEAIQADPSNADEYTSKLDSRVKAWYNQLDITVFVANNEQLPWTQGELDFKTRPMPPKATTGYSQVGDYNFHIGNRGGSFIKGFGGLVVERKGGVLGWEDFYGTLFNSNKESGRKNRDRFYDEIKRFHADDRFTDFVIFVECDIITWLNYLPPNTKAKSIMIPQKLAVLASLEARGAHVEWCGNRQIASRMYRDFVKQWVIKHWKDIIINKSSDS